VIFPAFAFAFVSVDNPSNEPEDPVPADSRRSGFKALN
jgi:hypothetical protein